MYNGAFILIFAASFLSCFLCVPWLIPKLRRAGLVGRDVNKPDKPHVPNIGGFAVIFGLCSGVLLAIALSTFFNFFGEDFHLILLLAAFSTVLIMSIVGVFDDLFSMHQAVKAALPLFASLPLVAVNAGVSSMTVPFIGEIELGLLYTLLLIPIGITGASNVTNMLAGFNGLEAGMGFVGCVSLAIIGLFLGETEAVVLLLAMAGALLAFFWYNRHPAKVFIGDTGTLTIGAVYACAVIIGNYEMAGVIITIPYMIDFFIKAYNGFPSSNWWGEYVNGKLVCKNKAIGLCQKTMKVTGGLSERDLVFLLCGIEAFFGAIAIIIFNVSI